MPVTKKCHGEKGLGSAREIIILAIFRLILLQNSLSFCFAANRRFPGSLQVALKLCCHRLLKLSCCWGLEMLERDEANRFEMMNLTLIEMYRNDCVLFLLHLQPRPGLRDGAVLNVLSGLFAQASVLKIVKLKQLESRDKLKHCVFRCPIGRVNTKRKVFFHVAASTPGWPSQPTRVRQLAIPGVESFSLRIVVHCEMLSDD